MSKKKYIIPIFIPHQGCPHDCVFCNQRKIATDGLEVDGSSVEATIRHFLALFPQGDHHREVAYYGGSFTGLAQERQRELLLPAHRAKIAGEIDGIRLSTRPDYISTEILLLLKEYGVTTIELGVQSTDNNVLALSNRGHNKNDVDNAVELIKAHGFFLGLQMMIGLPGDRTETVKQTVADFIQYQPDFVRVYPTIIIKDTALERLYHEGVYKPLTLEACIKICKEVLLSFKQNEIPVIRMGLQSTEEITYGKSIIAGPYHPAFREMVETEIYRDRIQKAIGGLNCKLNKHLVIYCHPKEASKVAGYQQSNRKYFEALYHLDKIMIKTSLDLLPGEIRVEG